MIQISPTDSVDNLIANNTSASSSFPGWANGVPTPGHVSEEPYAIPQQLMFHDVGWFGSSSHPNIGYSSKDPIYVKNDLKVRAKRGSKIDVRLWHGATSWEHASALVAMAEAQVQGTKFSLMIGSSIPSLKLSPTEFNTITVAQRTAVLNQILDFLKAQFFVSPAYHRINSRPLLYFFGVSGVDWNLVRSHVSGWGNDNPLFLFRFETNYSFHPQADGCFGWRHCDEAWVIAVKKIYAGKLIIPGICGSFDSSHKEAPILCTWGNTEKTDPRGGLTFQDELAFLRAHPEFLFALAVWNDYQESNVNQNGYVSGAKIILDEANGVLTWTDPGPSFAKVKIYVSLNGKDLMPLADIPAEVLSLDLKPIEFDDQAPYYFYAYGIGKPNIQNIMSNGVRAGLIWQKPAA